MPIKHAPRVDHWPQTLQSAAVLSGTLVRCGPGFRPVTWPDTPTTRAVAIAADLGPKFVACEETAAWIWGACRAPEEKLSLAMRQGRVPLFVNTASVTIHEYRFESDEVEFLGEYAVTTPLRTAYDLLRSTQEFSKHRHITCRLLLAKYDSPLSRLIERSNRASRSDHRKVQERLSAVYGIDAVTHSHRQDLANS